MKATGQKGKTVAGTKEGAAPANRSPAQGAAALLPMNGKEALQLYRSMLRIRRFETACNELYLGDRKSVV